MNPFSIDKDDNDALWSSTTAGFSLIELLVTIAVMGMVAGMVFTQRAGFSQSIGLKNVTQEIALAVRQAQVYGVTSRGSRLNADIDDFAYSIHFDARPNRNQNFPMYIDRIGNATYGNNDTLIDSYQLPSNMQIRYICTGANFSDTACNSYDKNEVIIKFSRPHPDAQILRRSGNAINNAETAVIVIEEVDSGNRRKVIVRASGYITVE